MATAHINNLTIKHSDIYGKYQVITPDGRVLEEFDKWEDAVKFCEDTRDFTKKERTRWLSEFF